MASCSSPSVLGKEAAAVACERRSERAEEEPSQQASASSCLLLQ